MKRVLLLLCFFALFSIAFSQTSIQELEELESNINDVLDITSTFSGDDEETLSVPTQSTTSSTTTTPSSTQATAPVEQIGGMPRTSFIGMMIGIFGGVIFVVALIAVIVSVIVIVVLVKNRSDFSFSQDIETSGNYVNLDSGKKQ